MNIYVFGLGAIGSNLLSLLVRRYPTFSFFGIDYDIVEERNLGTQVYLVPHVNIPKVSAMQAFLKLKVPGSKFTAIQKKIDSTVSVYNICNNSDDNLIIDCFDNSESRKILKDAIKENKLHIGFSPQYSAEIIWDSKYDVPGDVDPDNNDICALDDAVIFINYVVSFAGMVIDEYITNKQKRSYIITNKNRINEI